MIIKEFRIVIPMSVDEYQIGQLYTIQKKSRLESTGAGSGVEIIENKPFETETQNGQYTLKVYHVDERLPSALKTISKLLFPKSALLFEEESWNSYPYTRTKYHHKLFKSFSIDIESKYLPDYGQSENVFNISKKDLSARIVDYVDIVNDQINPNEYNPVEDPAKFQSKKSKCGPLGANWFDELKANANQKNNLSSINNQKVKYMCAYKLCRVECAFWGFQSKVEKLIVESVLRHMILMSHRQAWCWQDEYMDLSMDDVRRLELETQEYLKKKMRGELTDDDNDDTFSRVITDGKKDEKSDNEEFLSHDENTIEDELAADSTIQNDHVEFSNNYDQESDFADIQDDNRSQNSNLDEFFDAVSMSSNLNDFDGKKMVNLASSKPAKRQFSIKRSKKLAKSSTSSTSSSVASETKSKCKFDTLIIVVHGGNVTCTDTSKQNDFSNFKSTMEMVSKTNYGHTYGKVAFRLVQCNPICQDALLKLSALSPVTSDQSPPISESDTFAEESAGIFSLHENLPFNTLPLLALANRSQYKSSLNKFVRECNQVYQQFLNSSDGQFFQGQIVIVGDSLGSLLVYDSLCASGSFSNYSDDSSTLACSFKSSLSQSRNTNSSPASKSPLINRNSDFLPSPTISLNDKGLSGGSIKRISSNLSSINGIEFEPQMSNTVFLTDEKLEFDVTHFFVFGSPLGLILAQRKIENGQIDVPCCTQLYNMFHLTDPIALRIEPLLSKQFRSIEPSMIPRYSKFPLGDGSNLSLDHFILKYGNLFNTNALSVKNSTKGSPVQLEKINSFIMQESTNSSSNYDQLKPLQKIIQIKKNWWGENRIDYVLYAPEKIGNLPKKSLPYIFHSYYWESTDVVAFVLRMISKPEKNSDLIPSEVSTLSSIKEPVEKWQKRINRVKLRNLSANHRANDAVVLEDREQVLTAKFSYGPLDFALSGEKVDIFILTKSSSNEWKFYASEKTDNNGKLKYVIPPEKRLSMGVYQIKMMVRCDHTFAEFHLSVLPAKTEAVVFSIDGSFAANISFSGTDPKVRPGAVDVVRHWQDLGYLIIYITARPDYQHYKVTNWLAQHNFPFGMVFFSDGISRDPIKQKTETLKNIMTNSSLVLQAGYGSAKDIPMYANLGVEAQKIFIIGKTKSKYFKQAMVLRNGYASHLNELRNPNNLFGQANGNARLILKKGNLNVRQNTIFSNGNTDDWNSTNEYTMTALSNHHSISSM